MAGPDYQDRFPPQAYEQEPAGKAEAKGA